MLAALTATLALQAAPSQADSLRVEIPNARRVPCEDHAVAKGRSLQEAAQCFVADADTTPLLQLESDTPGAFRYVLLQVVDGPLLASKRPLDTEGVTWAGELPLRQEVLARMPTFEDVGSRPDMPVQLARERPSRRFAPGHYLIQVDTGGVQPSGASVSGLPEPIVHRLLLGMTITASAVPERDSWRLPDVRVRLAFPGCFERARDPVVSLALTDCDDRRYQVKAAAVERRGTLAQMVLNSLQAYRTLWFGVSRRDEPGAFPAIVLELEQRIGSQEQDLQKHFVELQDHFLVVTLYGPKGDREGVARRFGPRSDWLVERTPGR